MKLLTCLTITIALAALALAQTKLAEMSGDLRQKREFLRQYEEALKETTRLSAHPQ